MKKTKRELFYYGLDGRMRKALWRLGDSVCVSEVKLPAPSRKFDGLCCFWYPLIPNTVRVGDVVDIAIGDPIVLRGCKLLSRGSQKVPVEVRKGRLDRFGIGRGILTFRYKGGKVWVSAGHTCLLSKLKK